MNLRVATSIILIVSGFGSGAIASSVGKEQPAPRFHVPNNDEVRAAYPPGATGTGKVNLVCTAGADGSLSDCRVSSEVPTNQGFGAAALRLASAYRLPGLAKSAARPINVEIDVFPPAVSSGSAAPR